MKKMERLGIISKRPQSGTSLVATLVVDMKPSVAVKGDFECRYKSKAKIFFEIFVLSIFSCKEHSMV